MKDKLVLERDREGWRVIWWVAELEDIGGMLGELRLPPADPPPNHDDWDAIVATRAAAAASPDGHDTLGYYWYSKSAASAALRAANAARKNKPLADWEQKALAAVWKPPKGRL